MIDTSVLARMIEPGCRIAVGDGAGMPISALEALSLTAADTGGVDLLLGWCPVTPQGLMIDSFASARTLVGGYELQPLIDTDAIRCVVARLGAVPALLNGPLRPAVLIASVGRGSDGGWRFLTEVSWLRAAVDAGATVAGIEVEDGPVLDSGPALPPDRVALVGRGTHPATIDWREPSDIDRQVADRVARLIPEGARLQFAPGGLGTAVLESLGGPVHVHTGIITPAVRALERRGNLLGTPRAPYVAGDQSLYEWSLGRVAVEPIEQTHDPARLGGAPALVAVNTAFEVDFDGQVNVEVIGGRTRVGPGGQPDFAGAATTSSGVSILALPTERRGRSTLVERLSGPVSTASHDVDVLVTEQGVADLRVLDRAERRRAIALLWSAT